MNPSKERMSPLVAHTADRVATWAENDIMGEWRK
jgi:hypothetical protein